MKPEINLPLSIKPLQKINIGQYWYKGSNSNNMLFSGFNHI